MVLISLLRLFLRIVGLKPQADIDDEDGEEAYAPTFNVQEELVQFHVSVVLLFLHARSALTVWQHSPNDHAHWCAIFTIMTTRDSPDIKRFRTGPGQWRPKVTNDCSTPGCIGADLLHCLVSSQTITPAQNQKLLVSIETCVPRGYIHRIRWAFTYVIVLYLQVTRCLSAKIASQVYQDLMRERSQDPPTIDFSFHDSDGSVIQHALGCDELRLGDGTPIGTPLMDLLFKVNCSHGPGRIISGPSLTQDVEMACQWMCANPPPTVWRGLRLNPLHALGRWSLLVAEYRGPGIDVYVLDKPASSLLTPVLIRDVIIIDPLRTPVDAGPSEIFSQIVGTQRMKIHPILVSVTRTIRCRCLTPRIV